jgi:hypothetical protein
MNWTRSLRNNIITEPFFTLITCLHLQCFMTTLYFYPIALLKVFSPYECLAIVELFIYVVTMMYASYCKVDMYNENFTKIYVAISTRIPWSKYFFNSNRFSYVVYNATLNNIVVILCQSNLGVEKTSNLTQVNE